jgi:hypothetical protein
MEDLKNSIWGSPFFGLRFIKERYADNYPGMHDFISSKTPSSISLLKNAKMSRFFRKTSEKVGL